jgi:hypothetical protein
MMIRSSVSALFDGLDEKYQDGILGKVIKLLD